MSKGLIDVILDSIIDDNWIGKCGEVLTEWELKLVQFFGSKGKVLRNVYLPKTNGETSELDVIFITQKGIFIFESKNYSGWIFGDEQGQYWTAMLPNREKNRFYNPIKQNQTHLKWMERFVGTDIPLFSIIVFSERCELKKVTADSQNVRVIKRDRTFDTVREIWDRNPDVLDEQQVEALYERLQAFTNVDKAVKTAHADNIRNRYEKVNGGMCEQTAMICPRCGGKLVLRTAKQGKNVGKQFYGCGNFPKCRYTRDG